MLRGDGALDMAASSEGGASARAGMRWCCPTGPGPGGRWKPGWPSRLRLPVVTIVHNPADHNASWPARRTARRVLARSAGFLCHAASVEEHIRARFPGRPTAVHPLPPDRPPEADRAASRARLGVPDGHLALLCFGLIRPYKGVEVLLEAMASLPKELPVTLLLAGEPWGEAGERLRRRLAAPDLAGRVVSRLEWVPEGEAAGWFAAADVAVLPYRSATGSAVAAQALGAGLPVVGSRVGGIAEVIEDGVSGLLVPPGRRARPGCRAAPAGGARPGRAGWRAGRERPRRAGAGAPTRTPSRSWWPRLSGVPCPARLVRRPILPSRFG